MNRACGDAFATGYASLRSHHIGLPIAVDYDAQTLEKRHSLFVVVCQPPDLQDRIGTDRNARSGLFLALPVKPAVTFCPINHRNQKPRRFGFLLDRRVIHFNSIHLESSVWVVHQNLK